MTLPLCSLIHCGRLYNTTIRPADIASWIAGEATRLHLFLRLYFLLLMFEGGREFIFYSGIVTEKLPVLQQITSDPHEAGNSVSTIKKKAWEEEGDLGEEGSRGRREGRKERTWLKHVIIHYINT